MPVLFSLYYRFKLTHIKEHTIHIFTHAFIYLGGGRETSVLCLLWLASHLGLMEKEKNKFHSYLWFKWLLFLFYEMGIYIIKTFL